MTRLEPISPGRQFLTPTKGGNQFGPAAAPKPLLMQQNRALWDIHLFFRIKLETVKKAASRGQENLKNIMALDLTMKGGQAKQ